MSKLAFAVLGSIVAMNAIAQDAAVKMSREELLAFLPGSKVTHINSGGSERKKAIERLGISERTLRYKLQQYRDEGHFQD